jgi:hypothetical protein
MEGAEEIQKLEMSVFKYLLDSKIEKNQEIIDGFELEDKRQRLFETDEELPKQEALELNKEVVAKAKEENEKLKEQKGSLQKRRPFIWNIEFAEIFAEGGFDIVVGNPPYLRQEDIADPQGLVEDRKQYKNLLEEAANVDFPDYFKDEPISARSDLYTYFYVRSLRLLNSNGVLTFVCSNSWLDVKYGTWLQRFLLKHVPTDFVIDNHAKRSFAEADVNTVITVMGAPKSSDIALDTKTRFVAFKKPFEDIAFSGALIDTEEVREKESNDTARTIVKSYEELVEAGSDESGKYKGEKWGGKFLRAPDIYLKIIESENKNVRNLNDIAKVKFGLKTGANKFFYLTEENIAKWGIEEKYLKTVFKSPRESKSIIINPDKLPHRVFSCNESKDNLKGTSALKYIKWGEPKGFDDRPSTSNKRWWFLDIKESPRITCPLINNTRLVFFDQKNTINDANLVSIYTDHDVLLSLNSTYNMLNLELLGVSNLGQGAIKLNPAYIKDSVIVDIPIEENQRLLDFKKRDQNTIFKECGINPESDTPISEQEPEPLPDRKELDDIIFDELELTEEERKDVYRAVCQLVHDRISKANSV